MTSGPIGFVWRVLRARPRLAISMVFLLALEPFLPGNWLAMTRWLVAWDTASILFLAMTAIMFSTERRSTMAEDASRDQEGEWTIFWITIAAIAASFAAILGEFSQSKGASDGSRGLHIGLVVITLLVSWLMTHTLFAMRYAHEYYDAPGDDKDGTDSANGLQFPGDKPPDYWDFFYFALVLGMTFQVSDVQITSRSFRRLATAHGLLGFLFNTVILALSVNIGASLL